LETFGVTSADDFVLQILETKGLVAPETIADVRARLSEEGKAHNDDSLVIDTLVLGGYLTAEQITQALADEFNMDVVDLTDFQPNSAALSVLDRDLARRYLVFPLQADGNQLDLAIADPMNLDAIDSLGYMLKMTINTRLATAQQIDEAIKQYYEDGGGSGNKEFDDLAAEMSQEQSAVAELEALASGTKDEEGPIIRYVHMLISDAVKRRASDIHLEPLEKRFRIRYRIDGVLQEVENPPKRLQPSIIQRLKLMANVSIAEKRIPQDGRIQINVSSKDIDLRVSVLPTVYGESIVMRILDKEGLRLGLPELGFFSDDQVTFERLIGMADGIFLVTGPTGSGKSTTLYSALNYINHPDRKIITVEDPVEYQMTGINQVQVRREVGMTFSSALRAMLRQAPNIIMIGEIRDLETAEIAVNASLTGHMVFSTLHTNDAPSAVTRLVDIGVKPFLVSASLRGAMAQRLIRRICLNCRKPHLPDVRELASIGMNESQIGEATFYKGEGCPRCNGTGYKGRLGIFEMLVINEEIQQMIYENRTIVELRHKARELGMRTMREDGIRKIASGVTSVDEVVSVTVGDMS